MVMAVRVEVTKHDRPGRKIPGCPATVCALGGEQTWRPEHQGISATSKHGPTRNRYSWVNAGSRPILRLGKADDIVEETGESTRCTAGVRDPASKERFSEITSGSSRGQQGLRTTCQDSSNEAKCRSRREPNGSGT